MQFIMRYVGTGVEILDEGKKWWAKCNVMNCVHFVLEIRRTTGFYDKWWNYFVMADEKLDFVLVT